MPLSPMQKRENRIEKAKFIGPANIGEDVWTRITSMLNNQGDDVLASGTETIAIGFWTYNNINHLFIVLKLSTNKASIPTGDRIYGELIDILPPHEVHFAYATDVADGLHAEMYLVRAILNDLQGDAKQNIGLLRNLKIICLGKPVCPDCGGWMNSHGISHMSILFDYDLNTWKPEYQCGKRTQTWIHPRTGSKFGKGGFGYQADPTFYKKSFLTTGQ